MPQQMNTQFASSLGVAGTGLAAFNDPGYSVEVDNIANQEWDRVAGGFADTNPEQTACYASPLEGAGQPYSSPPGW